ncbi:MAG: hypothetical protein ACYDAC_01475 [Candidatus Dormibacteria bacterium]
MALKRLSPQHLTHLYADRLAAGLSPVSVHHIHATVHRALVHAVRWGLVARNVADLVDPPRVQRREMSVLDPDQVRRLLGPREVGRWKPPLPLPLALGYGGASCSVCGGAI